jgi:hypothetical protein
VRFYNENVLWLEVDVCDFFEWKHFITGSSVCYIFNENILLLEVLSAIFLMKTFYDWKLCLQFYNGNAL